MNRKTKLLGVYDQVSNQAVKDTKSPTVLMTMLFDKACALLARAIQSSEADDDEAFHQATLHALQIVLSLRFVLDTESDSELSKSLFATYTSIAASLKRAKEEQDAEAIVTIYDALDELRTAWHSVS